MKTQISSKRMIFNFNDDIFHKMMAGILEAIRRDINLFAEFGIFVDEIQKYENELTELKTIKRNENFKEDCKKIYNQRTILEKELRIILRGIMIRYKVKSESISLKPTYSLSSIYNTKAEQLVEIGESVLHYVISNKQILSEVGIDNESIHILNQKLNELKYYTKEYDDLVKNNIELNMFRRNLFNEAYKKSRLFCEIGKSYWADRDKDKYNDYLLYKTTGKQKNKI